MRIAVFGDSISAGAYDNKVGGWVNRLNLLCMNKCEDVLVYNRSISGDSTKDLLKYVKVECEALNPEIVIFAIGINDSRYTKTTDNYYVPPKQFEKNLKKLIKITRRFTKKIVFLALSAVDENKVTPKPWHDTEYYYQKNIDEYNLIIRKICKADNLEVIPLKRELTKNMLFDGLHPNSKGHQQIFEIVRDFLKKQYPNLFK